MTAENTLQWMMDFYPDLFPTRKHYLDHLFCVIGNGYEWVNGELVDNDEHSIRYKMIQNIEHAHGMCEDLWNENRKLHEKIQKINPKHKIPISLQFKWYPPNKMYSFLYDYPSDIKPDWLKILNECKELLVADGIEI